MKKIISSAAILSMFSLALVANAATITVSGNTAAGENQPGWMFGRDLLNATPYEFNTDEASLGTGSLYVEPISATAAHKFIGENFINTAIANVNTISYDFMIGNGGVDTEEEQFYMNVYANFGESDDLKFYDCRYDVVPTVGSTSGFTTVTFDPTQAYSVTTRGGASASPFTCPAIPVDMDTLSAGSNIRMFSINLGDTTTSDEGLNGYFDKVVVNLDSGETVYDFEPAPVDTDNDGVEDADDLCPATEADADWEVSWGNNRWEVRDNAGVLTWYQNKVGKKGVTTATAGESIAYTYGCNGHQIIEMLNAELGSVMNGHLKYGLSSGVREEFHQDLADGVLDGMYHLETVVVPATDTDGVASVTTLLPGHDYKFKASGTANAGDGIDFDADYSYRAATSSTWTDAVSTYEYPGDTLLDLQVNGGFVNWDDDAVYNADHIYWHEMSGADAPVSFGVYDTYYPGNTGSLTVDIYAEI